ncbi:MAG TPA: hypothetical protein DCW29_14235 [Janthinobacterium sp.]|nr:hypothetical protein [Janthinobacterium sp.]
MYISATSGGGFAGLSEHYEVDTAANAAGRTLEAALAARDFFALPADATPEVVGADIPRWRITADDGGRRHTVSFADGGGPASARWQELLALIRAAA